MRIDFSLVAVIPGPRAARSLRSSPSAKSRTVDARRNFARRCLVARCREARGAATAAPAVLNVKMGRNVRQTEIYIIRQIFFSFLKQSFKYSPLNVIKIQLIFHISTRGRAFFIMNSDCLLTGDARPRFFESSSKHFARGAGAERERAKR